MSQPADAAPPRPRFRCDVPGCERQYLRSEHLNRHKLIHKTGEFVCPLCTRRFTRNDLLNAHLRRHERRGQPTSGLSSVASGSVTSAPTPATPVPLAASEDESSLAGSSSSSSVANTNKATGSTSSVVQQPAASTTSFASPSPSLDNHRPCPSSPDTGNTTTASWVAANPSLLQPPPTSAHVNAAEAVAAINPPPPSQFSLGSSPGSSASIPGSLTPQEPLPIFRAPHSTPALPRPPISSSSTGLPASPAYPPQLSSRHQQQQQHKQLQQHQHHQQQRQLQHQQQIQQQQQLQHHHQLQRQQQQQQHHHQQQLQEHQHLQQQENQMNFKVINPYLYTQEGLFGALPEEYFTQHFSNNTSSFLNQYITAPRPQPPSFNSSWVQTIINDCPALSGTLLSDPLQAGEILSLALSYCGTYLTIIHRPTFELSNSPTLLLLALCALGCLVSKADGASRTGIFLQKHVLAQVESSVLKSRADVWFLQTIIIVEHICKYSMTRTEHEMGEVLHSVIVTLARRNNFMVETPIEETPGQSPLEVLEVQWRRWAERELLIRIAHTIFINDVHYTVFFNHHPHTPVTMMKLPLPSHLSIWEASTATEWANRKEELARLSQSKRQLYCYNLQSAIEFIMSAREPDEKREYLERFHLLNPLSLNLLIHGLAMTICGTKYHCVQSPNTKAALMLTITDLEDALNNWRTCFDALSAPESACTVSWVSRVMHSLCCILLRNNLTTLQMAAGSSFSCGKVVTPQSANAAWQRLTNSEPVPHESLLHAIETIGACIDGSEFFDRSGSPGNCFYPPFWRGYAAYLGVLVFWGYIVGLENLDKRRVNKSTSRPSLYRSAANSRNPPVIAELYERESGVDHDCIEEQRLKADFSRLANLVGYDMSETNWEISREAHRVLITLRMLMDQQNMHSEIFVQQQNASLSPTTPMAP